MKYKFELDASQVDIIYKGLLELPGKYSLPLLNYFELVVREQNTKAEEKEENGEGK